MDYGVEEVFGRILEARDGEREGGEGSTPGLFPIWMHTQASFVNFQDVLPAPWHPDKQVPSIGSCLQGAASWAWPGNQLWPSPAAFEG